MESIAPISGLNLSLAQVELASSLGSTEAVLRAQLDHLDKKGQAEFLANQLEEVFLNQLISAMRETVPESGLFGDDPAQRMFTQMLDSEYARLGAGSWDIGFHDALVRQILGPEARTDEAEAVKGEGSERAANEKNPPDIHEFDGIL